MLATLIIILKAGIKHDTLAALRNSLIHMTSLLPDGVIMKAEEIFHHDDKPLSGSSHENSSQYHPYPQSAKQAPHPPAIHLENDQESEFL